MRNFQQKKSWRKVVESKPFLILFGALILFFAWSLFGFWNKMENTAQNKKMVENQITALQQQKDELSANINDLQTDQGKEKIFRENFGLAKAGEGEIVILDDNSNTSPPTPTPSGFWGFLKNLFR